MIALKSATVAISGFMLASDPGQMALWGLLAVNIFGIVKQLIDKKAERDRLTMEHDFRVEDAKETAKVRASIDARLAQTAAGIAANRKQLEVVGAEAKTAYDQANHLTEKIAIAAQIASDRNDVVVGGLSAAARAQMESVFRHQMRNLLQILMPTELPPRDGK